MRFITLIPCIFFSLCSFCQQTEALSSVEVSLNQQSFRATPFYFDIPFAITGNVPDNCFRITYSYKVKGPYKKWMTLPKNNSFSTEWKKDGGKFSLYCPGMHPNVSYVFEFKIFRNAVVDDAVKLDLKKKLATRFTKFAKDYDNVGFTDSAIARLNGDLNDIFLKQLKIECNGSEIRSKCDPDKPYSLNIRENNLLKPQFERFKIVGDSISILYNDLFTTEKRIETLYKELGAFSSKVVEDIDAILSGKLKMNKISAEYLKLPFAPSLPDFRSYTLLDGLSVLRKLLVPINNLDVYLKGERKINNNDLVVVTSPDYQSIYFLDALLKQLYRGVLKDTVGGSESARFAYLSTMEGTENLKRFIKAYELLEKYRKDLEQLIVSFPDLTAEIVLADALSLETISIPDVVTEKTPYISVEGGIGYSTSFQSGLTYAGANFYLSPVNKKATLSTFKGWNKFKKMFCFNVAIGNFFGTRPQNSFSLLGEESKSDLLVGAGLRLGRIIKVNAHWLPYKTTNTNTLAQDKILKTDFVISVGADINLLKALGNIAKVLKLTD